MICRTDIRIKAINVGVRVMTKNMLEVYQNMCYKASEKLHINRGLNSMPFTANIHVTSSQSSFSRLLNADWLIHISESPTVSNAKDHVSRSICHACRLFYSCLRQPWTENIDLGWVGRKPVNANPGLNVNWSTIFSCLKMFFTSNVWCSLRLLQLKIVGQTI